MDITELENEVKKLREDLDNILNTARDASDKYEKEQKYNGFKERNFDKLDKYADKLKKLNGDDFDIYEAALDEYDTTFSDIEESVYVTQLIAEIDKKLEALKEALGEDTITVEKTDEDDVVVKDGEDNTVAVASEADAEADADEEEKTELEKFEEDLERYL